ncbi:Mu transposase domain-containing protein [Cereibacter sphaeroides]|uniref:Mu transposase domain-containing protein n=1 Tax=Cereibacter sphaeroides TaxID=1063 RepID=UPI003AF1C452
MVARVTNTGGFLVHQVFYSAPSQLIGKRLRVHVYDDRIEAFLGATPVVTHPRRRGRDDGTRVHCVNYCHVIHALRRKPQALAGSVYRDGLFPRPEYAEAWAALSACHVVTPAAAWSICCGLPMRRAARPNWRA